MTALTDCILGFAYVIGPLMWALLRKEPAPVDIELERSRNT